MLTALRYLFLLAALTGSAVAYVGGGRWLQTAAPTPTLRGLEAPPSGDTMARVANAPRFSAGTRLILWSLFVLLAPIVATPWSGLILDRQSNAATFLLLAFYTGLDVLAAFLANGVRFGGLISGVCYLSVLWALFAYNVWICAFLLRLRRS